MKCHEIQNKLEYCVYIHSQIENHNVLKMFIRQQWSYSAIRRYRHKLWCTVSFTCYALQRGSNNCKLIPNYKINAPFTSIISSNKVAATLNLTYIVSQMWTLTAFCNNFPDKS